MRISKKKKEWCPSLRCKGSLQAPVGTHTGILPASTLDEPQYDCVGICIENHRYRKKGQKEAKGNVNWNLTGCCSGQIGDRLCSLLCSVIGGAQTISGC